MEQLPYSTLVPGEVSLYVCMHVCGYCHNIWTLGDIDSIFGFPYSTNELLSNNIQVNDLVILTMTFIVDAVPREMRDVHCSPNQGNKCRL